MADRTPLLDTNPPILAAGSPFNYPSWHDPQFIGPLMFGTLLQFGIFCILLVQAVVFFARQGHSLDDGRLFKLYTAAVLLFTTLEVAAALWRLYNICVLLLPWALLPYAWLELVLNSTVAASVHCFFIFRCYKLSRSKYVLGLILVVQLAQIGAGSALAVSAALAVQPEEIRPTAAAACATTVALDTVISVTLLVNLWRQRTGQGDVDTVVLRIIRMTIESIVPCLICVIFVLISVSNLGVAKLGSLFPAAVGVASPLYASALLTTLNSRPGLRRQLDSDRHEVQTSIHDEINFQYSDQSRRTLHLDVRSCTDPIQQDCISTGSNSVHKPGRAPDLERDWIGNCGPKSMGMGSN